MTLMHTVLIRTFISNEIIRASDKGHTEDVQKASGGTVGSDYGKVTIRVPKRFLDAIDYLVEMDDFPTRSEAIRAAVRNLVYDRVDLVAEKLKKMQDAERSIAQLEEMRKQYLKK